MNHDEENPLSTPSKDSLEMETTPLTQLPVTQQNKECKECCALTSVITFIGAFIYLMCYLGSRYIKDT